MTKRKVVSRRRYVHPAKVGTRRPGTGKTRKVRRISRKSSGRPIATQKITLPRKIGSAPKRVHLGIIEGEWKCSSCGTEGIGGGTKVCPNCGHPKDASEVYLPPKGDTPFLTELQLKEMGVDKDHSSDEECQYCTSKNKPGTNICKNCGAALTDVARTDRVCDTCGLESNGQKCPRCNSETRSKAAIRSVSSSPRRERSTPSVVAIRRRSRGQTKSEPTSGIDFLNPKVWGSALVLFLIFVIVFIFIPRSAEMRVQGVEWQSTIFLQEYQYNQHEGWSIPAGGVLVSSSEEVYRYEKVQNGTETVWYEEETCEDVYSHTEETCYDDGSCDVDDIYEEVCTTDRWSEEEPTYEDVPVYEDYYVYMLWEWVQVQPAVATGADFDPYWPEVQLSSELRESDRDRTFEVYFVESDGDKELTHYPDSLAEFREFTLNSTWEVTYSGNRVQEDSLQRIFK